MIRRLVFVLTVLSTTIPGCAALQSPAVVAVVQKVQSRQATVDKLVADMQRVFEGAVSALPESDRAAYREAFEKQVERYTALSLSTSQALDAVLEMQTDSPDAVKIGRLLVEAARGVYDVIRTFGGPLGVSRDEPAKLARIDAALAWLEEHP